ncbi:hypothetical protein PAMP_014070 [Pampus punctatissimus]
MTQGGAKNSNKRNSPQSHSGLQNDITVTVIVPTEIPNPAAIVAQQTAITACCVTVTAHEASGQNRLCQIKSENPEEQPSTGVLGRIGSWFSPWKGKNLNNPTENKFPDSNQDVRLEGEEESEESVKRQGGEQNWEEEKEHSSNLNSLGLRRDIFLIEEDATQSAHRDVGFVVSRSEPGERGPKEEEFVACRRKRIGQGNEREKSSNGTLAGRNSEKNASHLTHLSSSSKQGVVWVSDQAHTQSQTQKQVQAQTGKTLRVYLEETSVIHGAQDTCAGQEVVRTEIKKNLQILRKAKSSTSFHLSKSSSSTGTESKRPNVRPAVGPQSYHSALVGVSLKSHKDLRLQPEPDQEQTEADSMGRKNAARRKYKKNIQEDGRSSIQEKKPSNAQHVPEGFPTSDNLKTSCQGKSPKTQMGESSVNSSSNNNPSSQSTPGKGESKASCPDTVKHFNNQDLNSVIVADRACVVDGGAEMEDNDIYYKVERKTETPESKRRSIKVSLSEVKLFTKNVPLNDGQSPTGDDQDCKSALKNTRNEAKDKPETEIHAKLQDLKKTDDEPKTAVGRIGDKIRLYEHQAVGGKKQAFRSTRSADVSPVRKASDGLKKDFVLSDQRSRSAERFSTATSRFPSAVSDKPLSIKEQEKNLLEASVTKEKTIPQKPVMTGISQKSTSSMAVTALKSTEPDGQDKLDTKGQLETPITSDVTLKPDGRDVAAAGVKISIPTDSEVKHTETLNTEETASFSKHVTEKVSSSVDEVEGLLPDKQDVSDTKQQVFKNDLEALDKQDKQLCSSSKNENIDKLLNRQDGSPEPSVNKDEPDTAACSRGTKKPIDRVILPQKEEKAGGNSLSFTSEDSRETSASSHSKAAVCAVTQANKAVNGTKSDRGPSKGEKAINVPELSTGSPGPVAEPVVIAAKPQPNSLPVKKTENSAHDSHTHGANDDEFSNSMPITKASTAVEEVTVKVANDTPVLRTAQKDNMAEKGSSVREPTPISKSVSSGGTCQDDGNKRSDDKLVASISADKMKPTPSHPQCEESKNTASISDITSLKDTEKILQSPPDTTESSATVHVLEKTAEKIFDSPVTELSPVANGGISPQVNNKPNPTLKVSPSSKANKQIPDSIQHSSLKKLSFPRGLSRDDSATWQDAPSSWLDVDFPKRKLEVSKPTLTSSGSESNLLDTSGELDDDEFVEKIKKLCAPFSLPPRKHNNTRPPKPTFVMPAIKEDRFEKTFDHKEFKFGLRKNNNFVLDTGNLFEKLQNSETKAGLRPVRASLADRSILLSSLDSNSRLKDKNPVKNEEAVKEEKDDHIKVKSRLEGSCVFSSLTSSSIRGKRNGVQTEGTKSGDVSPSEGPMLCPPVLPQSPLPSPTGTSLLKNTQSKQSLAPSDREEAPAVKAVVSDSCPPLPRFENIKLPDYLQKYFPQEAAKPAQSIQGQEQVKTEVNEKMTTPVPAVEADLLVKPGLVLSDAAPSSVPGIPPTTDPTLPEIKQPPAQLQRTLSKDTRTAKGFCKRPGKMVLFEKPQFCGQAYDIFRDVADATSLQLSPLVSVKVVRGCWIIYEKPDFQGRSIALEEGGIELTNEWAESGPETEPHNNPPMLIGSIRLAVCDYIIPHIDLFTEPEGHGRVTPYHDDVIETGTFGIPLSTASIVVHSGVWLVFSDPGFEGMLAVLEAGQYPFPETWGFPSPFIGSLRPLKMVCTISLSYVKCHKGGYKVENPSEVKAVVYEKPGFEGSCLEIDSDVFSFCEIERDFAAEGDNLDSKKLKCVGSLKITRGLWVGYSQPRFEGQQHILEEGEYLDCNDWGGSEQLLSLRPILSDFASPHLKMFTDRNFGQLGDNIDVTLPIVNMDDIGYGMKTQSIDVIGGVWVVYEQPGFCGESYILEKGLYGSPEDWGALRPRIASAMPIVLDDIESAAKFKVQLFSDPGFQGSVLTLEDDVTSIQEGFTVASCKVLAGSSLPTPFLNIPSPSPTLPRQEFSLPSITLFERCGLRGKRVVFTDGSVNLQLAAGCGRVQSVFVEGGMWVLYEGINYRGAQILLKPGEVPDWHQISNWKKIGSLRPLLQKQVNIRLRNRQTGLMMSVTGDLENIKLLRIQVMEETDDFDQIWFHQNGRLHCKVLISINEFKLLEECCLSPSGSVSIAGSRLGLLPEENNQDHLWSITPEGFICYTPTSDLVLDVKGGHNFDKNQVILNTFDPIKLTQKWNVEII